MARWSHHNDGAGYSVQPRVWDPEGEHSGEPHKYVSGEEFEAAAAAAMEKALDERSNRGRGRR